MARPSAMPSAAPASVSAMPSASTCRTTVARLTPMARSVAISPRRSLTVIVRMRGDEQHRHDEAHRAQDVGELAEVDQPLAEVDRRGRRRC